MSDLDDVGEMLLRRLDLAIGLLAADLDLSEFLAFSLVDPGVDGVK